MATVLTAHDVADDGGETEFASTYAAYDDLSDDEKERFADVRVVHTIEATQRLVNPEPHRRGGGAVAQAPAEGAPAGLDAPLRAPIARARRHHRVRRRDGPAEGRAFLDDLLARATAPDRVYRHSWAVGDMVIWDNSGVLHRALPYDATSARDMHRTTLYGKEAVQ